MLTGYLLSRSVPRNVAVVFLIALATLIAVWKAPRTRAASFTSTQSGNWGSAATWGGAGVPGCGDDVTIANTHTVTFNSNVGGLGCNLNITINSGGTLDLGGFELNWSGNNVAFTNNGTFTNSGAFNRLVSSNGGAHFTFGGNGIYSGNLKLQNVNAVWHIAANTSFTFNSAANNINIQSDNGTFDVSNPLVIMAPSVGSNYVILDQQGGSTSGSSLIKTQGNVRLRQTGGEKIHVPVETVSGASQGDGSFGKGWTVDAGASLSLNGTLTVANNDGGAGLIISNSAIVDLAGNTLNIAFNGPFTNNGTVNNTGAFSRIVFMDNGTHTVSGTGNYNGNVGWEAFNNTTNITAGSSLTFGAPAGNTNIQVDSGANLNFTGSGSLTLSGSVSNGGSIKFNEAGPNCGDGNKITIRSSVAGTQRAWNGSGQYVMKNVDVRDQAGTSPIVVAGGLDSGNNGANWTFSSPCVPTVQFSAGAYPVGEGNKRVDVTIQRVGDTSGAASVSFATSDLAGTQNCNVINGAASSRCDYETRLKIVKFAAGESSKTISVFIVDDAYLEGPETFTVGLSSPAGAALGTPSTATVTITDNDLANGANPIDSTGFFVFLHYLDFLNRESDTGGQNFWEGQIDNCTTKPQCLEVQRVNVSASFFLSIEFQQTGYLVERMYKAAYNDKDGTSTLGGMHTLKVPIVLLNEFLLDTQQIGEGVIVLQPGWEMVLENNKQAFALEFVQRTRFTNAFATTLTPTQFVDMLFTNAGVTPSGADRTAAINEFGGAPNTTDNAARARALRRVAENTIFAPAEFNRAFVLMQYFGYLRRNPNDFQDSDHTGYEFWLNKLNQFNGNYVNAEMVKAFITSIEYRQRFGPP